MVELFSCLSDQAAALLLLALGRPFLLNPLQWIDAARTYMHLPVQMRASRHPTRAHRADDLAGLNQLPLPHQHPLHMPITTVNAPAVVENHRATARDEVRLG